MPEQSDFRSLSATAAKSIDWSTIEDVMGAALGQDRGTRRNEPRPIDPEQRDAARRAFAVVKQEFDEGLAWLRTVVRLVLGGILVAAVIAIGGGMLLQLTPWASVISIASIGALVGLLIKVIQLARDQAMLELVPARYLLAIEFCGTDQDAQALLARFMQETSSLRKT